MRYIPYAKDIKPLSYRTKENLLQCFVVRFIQVFVVSDYEAESNDIEYDFIHLPYRWLIKIGDSLKFR